MKKNLWSKIMILLVIFFFVMQSLSPAQDLSKLYEIDDNIELKAANNISPQQQINPSSSGEVVVGEKLDSIDYGPGFVEHMDDSIARDILQRSNLNVDLKEGTRQHGIWAVPSREASYYPHSGKHNVINKWGDTKMGIAFPTKVDIHGAWFVGQGGGEGVWASSIRVIGYLNGEHTQTTDWFEDIDDIPSWFAVNLQDVDRIVDCSFNQNLNGSNFAGLTWETGTGDFYTGQDEMPSPQASSNSDKKELSLLEGYSSNSRENNPISTPTLISDYQGVTTETSLFITSLLERN